MRIPTAIRFALGFTHISPWESWAVSRDVLWHPADLGHRRAGHLTMDGRPPSGTAVGIGSCYMGMPAGMSEPAS